MAKQRPHTIILTELVATQGGHEEKEVGVPVAQIRKLTTDKITTWGGENGRVPTYGVNVTHIRMTDKSTMYVKESVRSITKMLNGDIEVSGTR